MTTGNRKTDEERRAIHRARRAEHREALEEYYRLARKVIDEFKRADIVALHMPLACASTRVIKRGTQSLQKKYDLLMDGAELPSVEEMLEEVRNGTISS